MNIIDGLIQKKEWTHVGMEKILMIRLMSRRRRMSKNLHKKFIEVTGQTATYVSWKRYYEAIHKHLTGCGKDLEYTYEDDYFLIKCGELFHNKGRPILCEGCSKNVQEASHE